ncbi:transglutaminase domain-containing protein [Thalassotalea ganghwensis]
MKIKAILLTLAMVLSLCLSGPVIAEQTSFIKLKRGESYLFKYQWRDINDQPQSLAFSIPRKSLFAKFRGFRRYKSAMANEYVKTALKKHFRQHPITGVTLEYTGSIEGNIIEVSGRNEQLVNQTYQTLMELEQKFFQQYLEQSFYHQFNLPTGEIGIKPDHLRFARLSVDDLKVIKSIVLDEVEVKNIRKVTNYLLGFVQNIPYETLESRATSLGAGYNPPLRVLWENKGDCDSKATLTVAMLRALMPRIKMALVFIDKHALLGINVPPQGNDSQITIDNVTYVLADPTGPRLMNLGQISAEVQNVINSGHYTIETFHD